MIRNHLIKNFDNPSSSWSDEENHTNSYYALDGIRTRIVWVTNYINNEDFPIYVSADDPLLPIVDTIEQESSFSNEKDDTSLLNKLHTLDLSKLNLDDLLLLLYHLQQKTIQNSVTTSNSTISSSSRSSSSDFTERKPSSHTSTLHSLSPTLSHAVQSSLSMLNEIPSNSHPINRRQSAFTLPNIADVPKQLTTTLAKPISSFHSPNIKHIHSPNDVVNKLLQSFNLRNNQKLIQQKSPRYSSRYTYQESEQHKAKLISNLLSSNSMEKSSYFVHSNP